MYQLNLQRILQPQRFEKHASLGGNARVLACNDGSSSQPHVYNKQVPLDCRRGTAMYQYTVAPIGAPFFYLGYRFSRRSVTVADAAALKSGEQGGCVSHSYLRAHRMLVMMTLGFNTGCWFE